MNLLEVKAVSKSLQGKKVVDNISFNQLPGQKLAIAGETGSGKSTLLKMICGWVQPDGGQLFFNGERILGPDERLLPGHPKIGYLSQHFELRNNYRVKEILEMALQMEETDAQAIYEVCRIDHLLKRRTDQLSGGEKQRIAAARLLISSPKLLLLDEPYSNLDVVHRNILKEVIRDIGERLNITCLLISHDPADVLSWADEIIVLKDGRIIQQDTPQMIYNSPKDEYTAGLFGKFNMLSLQLLTLFLKERGGGIPRLSEFLRPEKFTVHYYPEKGLPATVMQLSYLGSNYEAEVLVDQTVITVRTNLHELQKGDTVYISLYS